MVMGLGKPPIQPDQNDCLRERRAHNLSSYDYNIRYDYDNTTIHQRHGYDYNCENNIYYSASSRNMRQKGVPHSATGIAHMSP